MTTENNKTVQIKISSINLIAQVTYKNSEDCEICRKSLMIPSPIDIANMKNNLIPENHVDVGNCNHAFHRSCINKLTINGQCSCPKDNTPWNYKYSLDSTTSWNCIS
jgi:hypothetical protein